MKIRFVMMFCALFVQTAAYAGLIDQGDTTLDTGTGLEWLDLTKTVGLSYNGVLASSFVITDGFRYATEAEVLQLYTNAGGIADTNVVWRVENKAPSIVLLDLMGCTSYLVGNPCGSGPEQWSPGMWGASSEFIGLIDDRTDTEGILATRWVNWGNDDDSFREDVGAFLVKEAVTPEPTSLALLCLGLAGLGFSRRKTH